MGKSSGKGNNRCSCGSRRSNKSFEVCPKCSKRGQNKKTKKSAAQVAASAEEKLNKKSSVSGRMDSKHFSSRSTTDNLPSSLSTPGERAGLSSAPSTAVDTTSVVTSSNSPNTMSPHLPSTCGTAGPSDITSHSTNPPPAEAEGDTRLPPDAKDSDSSLSTTSDPLYDPKCDSNVCSSNSCSSLSSSLSAVISSSSKGHNDDYCVSDFQGNGISSTDNQGLSQTAKSSINSSVTSNNAPSVCIDTTVDTAKCVASSSSNKDNISSANERPDDQIKDGLCSTTQNAKSRPTCGPLSGSSVLKDSKPSVEDESPQSPTSRGVKRTHKEMDEPSEASSSPKPSPQKNKKRCFICSCKLELAQRTIGKCRCERVFCPMHRLPELHDCEFNHKEDGRREAREKMVKPTRHMGTSFRRDDQTR